MAFELRVFFHFFGILFAEGIRPVVDLGRIPLGIGGEVLVEGLDKPALAKAGLGEDDRHAGAARWLVGPTAGGLVPQATQPSQFLLATVEAGNWNKCRGHGGTRLQCKYLSVILVGEMPAGKSCRRKKGANCPRQKILKIFVPKKTRASLSGP